MSKKKKPRNKLDTRKFEPALKPEKKKEKDWTFEDIARFKTRRY